MDVILRQKGMMHMNRALLLSKPSFLPPASASAIVVPDVVVAAGERAAHRFI